MRGNVLLVGPHIRDPVGCAILHLNVRKICPPQGNGPINENVANSSTERANISKRQRMSIDRDEHHQCFVAKRAGPVSATR